MDIKFQKIDKYAPLVNFKNNKTEKIHRWFHIKEGYSKELIFYLLDVLKINEGYIVDFFNGSGTTTLAAKERRFNYYGFENNPFLYLLSKVKLEDYTQKDFLQINKIKEELLNQFNKEHKDSYKDFNEIKLSILKKVFQKNLENLLQVRNLIFKIKPNKIRDFFLISLTSILEEVGAAKKDGNGLKYPKNKKVKNFIPCWLNKLELMTDDIKNSKIINQNDSKLILADSRNISKKDLEPLKNKTSLVVFSPPYANCFDYSETYKLELWIGGFVKDYKDLKTIKNSSLSSHLNKDLNKYEDYDSLKDDLEELKKRKIWNKKIYQMLNGYFFDMQKILFNSYSVLSKGGSCVVIVANSAYSGYIIQTDKILSQIAFRIGFSEVQIEIARKIRSSSQQAKLFKNGNSLRESLVIMRKTQ